MLLVKTQSITSFKKMINVKILLRSNRLKPRFLKKRKNKMLNFPLKEKKVNSIFRIALILILIGQIRAILRF